MTARQLRALRLARLVGAAAIVAAAFHHGRLAAAGVGDVTRHEVFVGLDLALAALLALRPRWALAPTIALTLQQSWSHGADLVASLQGPGPIDTSSALVIVFFPALVALLIVERGAGR